MRYNLPISAFFASLRLPRRRRDKLGVLMLIFVVISIGFIKYSAAQSRAKKNPVKLLFDSKCAKCHGTDGRGQTVSGVTYGAPDFTNAEWQNKANESEMALIIEQGRNQMPAFGKELTKEDTKSLITYIRAFRRK